MRIVISSGEVSGDEHAAKLALAIKSLAPGTELRGMGGRHSRDAGVEIVVDAEKNAAAMGFIEVLSRLGKIRGALNEMKKLLREWKPDLLIVVDFPDFHFLLSKYAKKIGIKVLYFIIPKMWIWRTGRIEHFKKYIDHAACIFPFERDFCTSHGYDSATYVGHPYATEWKNLPPLDREKYLRGIGLDPDKLVVALFPGSRPGEIKRHMALMIGGFAKLAEKHPGVQGIIPVPGTLDLAAIRASIPEGLTIAVVEGDSVNALRASELGLIKSGTANLQASFCELPFVMFFTATKLTEFIVKRFVRTKEYSIVNLLKNGTILELMQENANPERMAAELDRFLTSDGHRAAQIQRLRTVNSMLMSFDEFPGCSAVMSAYDRTAVIARHLCSHRS